MGYVRMQQSNFGGAISFLEQAQQDGAKDAGIETALSAARFYYTMGEGAIALNENDLTTAEKQYQSALQMRPASPEALEGLGGTLMKAQQPEVAIQVFERYVKVKPSAAAAWRGLFMAKYGAGNAAGALQTERDDTGGRPRTVDERSRFSADAGLGLFGGRSRCRCAASASQRA